jgi:hypothetical protein
MSLDKVLKCDICKKHKNELIRYSIERKNGKRINDKVSYEKEVCTACEALVRIEVIDTIDKLCEEEFWITVHRKLCTKDKY